jgi:Flp pilus assembly protein TadG
MSHSDRRPVRRHRTVLAGDRGQVTILLLPLVIALLGMAGLVIDGGAALAARQQAANLAEQAARAGADQIDPDSLRGPGPSRVDPAAAQTAADRYLTAQQQAGHVDVDGSTVTVAVTIRRPTTLLGLFGVRSLTVTAHSSARSVSGIGHEEQP